MIAPGKIIVIDDNPDSRFLLTRTLIRKFPLVLIVECASAVTAVSLAQQEPIDAIVLHRSSEMPGVELVRELRAVNSRVPIIMVSGIDRAIESREAGADCFLNYDEWLRVGTVVADMLMRGPHEPRVGESTDPWAPGVRRDTATSGDPV